MNMPDDRTQGERRQWDARPPSDLPASQLNHLILSSLEQAIFTVDEDMRISSFNAAAEALTGLSSRRAIGRWCFEVFRTDHCCGECPLRRTLGSGEPARAARIWLHHRSRRRAPVGVHTTILRDDSGSAVGAVEMMWRLARPAAGLCSASVGVEGELGQVHSNRPSIRAILEADIQADARPLRSPEAQRLVELLQAHGWRREKTAAALGISRSTLWRRMKEFDLID